MLLEILLAFQVGLMEFKQQKLAVFCLGFVKFLNLGLARDEDTSLFVLCLGKGQFFFGQGGISLGQGVDLGLSLRCMTGMAVPLLCQRFDPRLAFCRKFALLVPCLSKYPDFLFKGISLRRQRRFFFGQGSISLGQGIDLSLLLRRMTGVIVPLLCQRFDPRLAL